MRMRLSNISNSTKMLFPILVAGMSVALVGCESDTLGDELACTEENNCYQEDGELFCDEGYTWENEGEAENYRCVKIEDDSSAEPEPPPEPECDYPEWSGAPTGVGSVIPDISYSEVYFPGNTTGTFGFRSFFCDDEWDDFYSMTVILVTEWCTYCPGLVSEVDALATHLAWNRSLLVYLVLQDSSQNRADSVVADSYISGYVGQDHGIRIGDGEADISGAFDNMWSFVPNGFVVERSSMAVYAHAAAVESHRLDYVEIAEEIYLANRD